MIQVDSRVIGRFSKLSGTVVKETPGGVIVRWDHSGAESILPLDEVLTDDETPLTLTEWANAAFLNSKAHGWHDEDGARHRFPERCMLMVTEICELFEGARTGKLTDPCDKPIALSKGAEEAADIFIRLADFCKEFGIDLEHAVRVKHEYNKGRPMMHGGKKF